MSESVIDDCLWPIEPGPCCRDIPDGTDPALIESAIAVASDLLHDLSGKMIGQCFQTVRPLHQCAECRYSCCGGADGIPVRGLDGEHVAEVVAVTIGATTVDPATYWWDEDEQMLWRVPPARWPTKDTRWEACGTGTAFCVEILAGVAPRPWDLRVAEALVCELVKSCIGAKCRIPTNATQVNAQGVTITLDPRNWITLIPEVSGWVAAVNPLGVVLPSTVWSPDTKDGNLARTGGGRRPWWR